MKTEKIILFHLWMMTQTSSAALNDLKEENWIGYDPKSDKHFIRGFSCVQRQYGLNRRISTIFYIEDIESVKAFLIASVISNLIRQGKRKKWREEALKNGKAIQSNRTRTSFHLISNMALSKILKISLATASRYKDIAKKRGYVNIKKNYEPVGFVPGDIRTYNKYSQQRKIFKTIKGQPVFTLPDKVSTNVLMRRRRS